MCFRMSWLLTVIILSFTFNNLSEARFGQKLPSAVVVGTVYCDTCFQEDFSKYSHFISGALVAVECGDTSSKPNFRKEVKTNMHGEFKVQLPFSVAKDVNKIKECSVKLISSSEPNCAVASTATSSSFNLKSKKPGTQIFSAGFFTFKPLKQPDLCSQKPSTHNSNKRKSMESLIPNLDSSKFPPKIQDSKRPNFPSLEQKFFTPLPQLPLLPPLPQLPPLPPLPGIPYFPPVSYEMTFGIPLPPNPLQPPSIFPPNPLQPPPSLLPPNPFQPPPSVLPPIIPSPPSSIFPPTFPSPPPSIFPPIPPIPGFTPPRLPPPAFPFPIPPIPLPPSPVFPGIPPALSSSKKTIP